jgi:hypothetical protein
MIETREKQRVPRFHPKTIIPKIPEGMKLVKFHNEPAFIPERTEGESLSGKYPSFTDRQVDALMELERRRVARLRATKGGAPHRLTLYTMKKI